MGGGGGGGLASVVMVPQIVQPSRVTEASAYHLIVLSAAM